MDIAKGIRKKNILVIGDIMLDKYYMGNIHRISPEAPVPVFLKKETRYRLGGAANVALNIAVNGPKVSVISAAGNDGHARILKSLMQQHHISTQFITDTDRPTCVKTRLLAGNNQQVLRIDTEEDSEFDMDMQNKMTDILKKHIGTYDIVVFSDYMKGVLAYDAARRMLDICRQNGVKTLVDVKDSRSRKYENAFLVKPNREELMRLTGMPAGNRQEVWEAAVKLMQECHSQYVLVTCGAQGMVLAGKDGTRRFLETAAREVYDVTGAGDTVLAYMAMGLAAGMSVCDAMEAANAAAGIQVSKAGTSAVKVEEVRNYVKGKILNKKDKILAAQDIEELAEYRRRNPDKKIVFTNGCFDILHIGHLRYLKQAAGMGDILIVGLNSDKSVRRIKGENRPVNQEADRAEMLSGYSFIDYIVIFEEDTPFRVIEACQPDILVKGGDYRADEVIGAQIVKQRGGRVEILPYINGKSTSGILKKINGGNEKGG